eukprot:3267404-Prymnesium_polylepis.1
MDDLEVLCSSTAPPMPPPLSPPLPPSAPVPTLILDERFANSAQFSVVDRTGAAQTFFSDGWYDYFGLIDGPRSTFSGSAGSSTIGFDPAPRAPPYDGFDPPFLVAQDIDGDGALEPFTLTWSGINTSSCEALFFSGKFAESGSRGADEADYVRVEASIDGGTAQQVLWFSATGDGANDRFARDLNFDGVGDRFPLAARAQTYWAQIQGKGSSVDLRIRMLLDNAHEDIAIDDVRVLCSSTAPPSRPPTPPSPPPMPPRTPVPSLAMDEPFDSVEQFRVVDRHGTAQQFFSDGWYDYFGLLNGESSTFTGNAGSNITGSDAAPRHPVYYGFRPPFLVAQDLNGEGGVEPFTLTWGGINISSCGGVMFSGKFAEGGIRGTDTADYVHVEASIDGGA